MADKPTKEVFIQDFKQTRTVLQALEVCKQEIEKMLDFTEEGGYIVDVSIEEVQ